MLITFYSQKHDDLVLFLLVVSVWKIILFRSAQKLFQSSAKKR